jgi:putative peptidoglycan lipid II flippase
VNVALMIGSLVRRDAYGPTRAAFGRLLRVVLASAVLFAVLIWADSERVRLVKWLGSKEAAIAFVIFAGGTFYFVCAFLFGAVTLSEVRQAFRRERGGPDGGAGGGLPGGMD